MNSPYLFNIHKFILIFFKELFKFELSDVLHALIFYNWIHVFFIVKKRFQENLEIVL